MKKNKFLYFGQRLLRAIVGLARLLLFFPHKNLTVIWDGDNVPYDSDLTLDLKNTDIHIHFVKHLQKEWMDATKDLNCKLYPAKHHLKEAVDYQIFYQVCKNKDSLKLRPIILVSKDGSFSLMESIIMEKIKSSWVFNCGNLTELKLLLKTSLICQKPLAKLTNSSEL